MSSPPLHASKEPQKTSATHCDPDQPSTTYYIPGEARFLDSSSDQQSALVPFSYGQISYEVEDPAGTFNYSFNPRHSMSKYLEDVDSQGSGMLDAPLETLSFPAPASVPSNFSYLTGPMSKETLISDSCSPPDGAQFSPPEYNPELMPLSAPMSSESQYIPSPSEHSEELADSHIVVGQPAVNATLKDVEGVRYESPKNHDESWIMRAFYSSSEDFNSPEEWDVRKSTEVEDNTQLGTDESDGRASLVDKLFAMLERAEESGEDEETDENDVTLVRDSQPTPEPTAEHLPGHFPLHYRQTSPIQDVPTAIPAYLSRQILTEYAADSFHSQNTYGLPQIPYLAPSELILQQRQEQLPIIESSSSAPAPAPPMVYTQPSLQTASPPPPSYAVPPTHQFHQPPHQYFRPIPTDYLSQPQMDVNISYSQIEPSFQDLPGVWNVPPYRLPGQPVTYLPPRQFVDTLQSEEFVPQEPESVLDISQAQKAASEASSASVESESATDPDVWESVSVRRCPQQDEMQEEEEGEVWEEPRPKGPPFEQKGPTFNKDIKPVPPPPPSSPVSVLREKQLEAMDPQSFVQQFEREIDHLEDVSIREISDYDRQQELNELRQKMCDRFQRLYPNLFSDEDEETTDVEPKSSEEEDETGDPPDGEVIRNGIQLTARYLALWFPDEKERKEMIPWNILRKIKAIRLCFLDNRVGHGEYETFNIGEFVTTTGHMMFAYGDGPEALDETRLFVLDIVRQQMNMLLRRVWYQIVQKQERRVFTYSHIFSLYKKHPIRLRRLVRYLVEQNRKRHMLYRVTIDQGRRRGQNYFENRMGVNETGATEVICLRKRAPHIYYALEELYKDKLEFLCEERRLQDCDPELAEIKMFLKRRNRHLSAENKELLDYARRVSYCSRTGRLSSFRAHRFHEFLGFPDMQTDLIYVLDFMAREIVMEVTYKAALVHKREQQDPLIAYAPGFMHKPISKTEAVTESLGLHHYEEALRSMEGWQDILFGAEENKILLSYGKNPIKWESDGAYNQREAAERRDFEKDGPIPRRTLYLSCAELFEEHKKVLRGEYWDSSPEDLTKEAIALANAYAEARRLKLDLKQPPVPPKWKQQDERDIADERERLEKLRSINRQHQEEMRLTEQLVKLMAKSNINDSCESSSVVTQKTNLDEIFDLEKARKAVYTAVRRRKAVADTQQRGSTQSNVSSRKIESNKD
ncbi:hypothetical protein NECAME_05172 [Necator americanus]|uniref:Uncharacterized protein n=1 Tax=Necator americanus TaxID=51031 RepID=W2SJ46_NECAM|nr:hypothetical protein NECAME_05172 [Necator americanus]ETN69593.1 hypothetical protein NECAME_05172 [Necator americanus]